jgi:hypothetical protein
VDRRVLHYPVRPFMMPALIRKRAEFPSLWNYTTNPNMPKGLPSAYPTMWGTSVSR